MRDRLTADPRDHFGLTKLPDLNSSHAFSAQSQITREHRATPPHRRQADELAPLH